MRKFFILSSAVLMSSVVIAGTQASSVPAKSSTHDLSKQLNMAMSNDHREVLHVNKNGEFDIVYGGKDISRVTVVNSQQRMVLSPTLMA